MGGNVGYIERHEAPSPSLSSVSDDPSDASLTAAWQTGDKAAFGVLFQRHADSLFDYCHRRCGDREVAEDLVQQAFLEAWRQRHSLVISSVRCDPGCSGLPAIFFSTSGGGLNEGRALSGRTRPRYSVILRTQ